MLTLTENASTIVKTLVDQNLSTEDAGLRFSQEGVDSGGLTVTTAEQPLPGDAVVERSSRSPEPRWPAGLDAAGERRYGETKMWFADFAGDPEVA